MHCIGERIRDCSILRPCFHLVLQIHSQYTQIRPPEQNLHTSNLSFMSYSLWQHLKDLNILCGLSIHGLKIIVGKKSIFKAFTFFSWKCFPVDRFQFQFFKFPIFSWQTSSTVTLIHILILIVLQTNTFCQNQSSWKTGSDLLYLRLPFGIEQIICDE